MLVYRECSPPGIMLLKELLDGNPGTLWNVDVE
jgi:hypothetical protein